MTGQRDSAEGHLLSLLYSTPLWKELTFCNYPRINGNAFPWISCYFNKIASLRAFSDCSSFKAFSRYSHDFVKVFSSYRRHLCRTTPQDSFFLYGNFGMWSWETCPALGLPWQTTWWEVTCPADPRAPCWAPHPQSLICAPLLLFCITVKSRNHRCALGNAALGDLMVVGTSQYTLTHVPTVIYESAGLPPKECKA